MLKFIVPSIDQQMPVLYRSKRVLPLVAAVKRAAFDNASARKTEKARMQISQSLNHVGPQAAGSIFPCVLRKQGDQVNIHGPFSVEHNRQSGLRVGVFGA